MDTAKQWRAAGYFTLFRFGSAGAPKVVFVVRKSDGETRSAKIDSGRWLSMRFEDMRLERLEIVDAVVVFDETERTMTPVLELRDSMRQCYCDAGVDTCDFCAGHRRPDPDLAGRMLPWETKKLVREIDHEYRFHRAGHGPDPKPDTRGEDDE